MSCPSCGQWCDDEYHVAEFLAERDRLRALSDALIPDVRLVLDDHFSGLREHRELAGPAFVRLEALLFDDDGVACDPLTKIPVSKGERG